MRRTISYSFNQSDHWWTDIFFKEIITFWQFLCLLRSKCGHILFMINFKRTKPCNSHFMHKLILEDMYFSDITVVSCISTCCQVLAEIYITWGVFVDLEQFKVDPGITFFVAPSVKIFCWKDLLRVYRYATQCRWKIKIDNDGSSNCLSCWIK